MSSDLEEEMRQALFGTSGEHPLPIAPKVTPVIDPPIQKPTASAKKPGSRHLSPKLRVTLHVTKEYEGEITIFTHDASTLSSLQAQQEAKAAAKEQKYKYFDVISTVQIG